MNPIACEEPISERRDDTRANSDLNESRPIHTYPHNTQGLYSCEGLCASAAVTASGTVSAQLLQNRHYTHHPQKAKEKRTLVQWPANAAFFFRFTSKLHAFCDGGVW